MWNVATELLACDGTSIKVLSSDEKRERRKVSVLKRK
jgi:hypothetical protein